MFPKTKNKIEVQKYLFCIKVFGVLLCQSGDTRVDQFLLINRICHVEEDRDCKSTRPIHPVWQVKPIPASLGKPARVQVEVSSFCVCFGKRPPPPPPLLEQSTRATAGTVALNGPERFILLKRQPAHQGQTAFVVSNGCLSAPKVYSAFSVSL